MAEISQSSAAAGSAASTAWALLEAIPVPALAVGRDGRILLANPAAQDLFMRSAALLARRPIGALVNEDSPLIGLLERTWASGTPVSANDIAITGAGLPPIKADVVASPSEDGGFVALMIRRKGLGRDLSERFQDVAGARSMAAMGRTLAHEVKNPLAGIRGAAQLLMRDHDEGRRQLAALIVEETDRISRLIDRMESFGADPPIQFSPTNVHGALERVATLAETGFASGIKVRRSFDPSLPDVFGDPDQLIQVFLNLAKNAAEAAGRRAEAGEIMISSAYRHGVRIRGPGGEARDLPLEIAFADNGAGVPDDVRDCLFEPFVTTKPGGTGLGLPLVQKIVAAHGGIVDFETGPGRTVFRIRLPVARQPAA